MVQIPPYLKKGDRIGIICPAGYMPKKNAATCIATLQEWGYQVVVGKTLGSQFHYFSGTDQQRLADLQAMLDNSTIQAILCGRGGYGMSRIIDQLNFTKFKKYPKWLIGFSDITVLHSHLYQQIKFASLHAPMAAAFNKGGANNQYVQSLKKALKGGIANYACAPHTYNTNGKAKGELIGGNLSLIAHLIGTKSSLKTTGKILFIEDVGEYLYNIDRMIIQLKRAGLLNNLAGLIIGGFTEMKDTITPFGNDVLSIIKAHLQEYNYPICFDFPVSHTTENYALKIGLIHELTVNKNKTSLKEIR